jgi:hypothetical protein
MFNFISKSDQMKKMIFFSIFLIITLTVIVSAQDSKTSHSSPWTISLSYSPKHGLNLFDSYTFYPYKSYFFSLDLKAEKRLSDKFSYSLGIDFNRNHENISQIIFDAPAQITKAKSYLIEFPIQINYYIITNPKNIDPYIKMSLRNSYLYFSSEGTIGDNPILIKNSDYILFYDLGFGSNFKINDKISIMIESSIVYGLIYKRNSFNYWDGLIGIRYTLKK